MPCRPRRIEIHDDPTVPRVLWSRPPDLWSLYEDLDRPCEWPFMTQWQHLVHFYIWLCSPSHWTDTRTQSQWVLPTHPVPSADKRWSFTVDSQSQQHLPARATVLGCLLCHCLWVFWCYSSPALCSWPWNKSPHVKLVGPRWRMQMTSWQPLPSFTRVKILILQEVLSWAGPLLRSDNRWE